MSRYESKEDLAAKVEWEGCILDAIEYGIKPADLPEDAPYPVVAAWWRLYHQGMEDVRTIYRWLNQEGDDPEGGSREPAGDSPDSPPAGESRLPGGSDDYVSAKAAGDDTRHAWPVIPPGVSYRCVGRYVMWVDPDGSLHTETMPPVLENSAP